MDHDYTCHIMPRKARPTQRGNYAAPIILLTISVIAWLLLFAIAAFAQSSNSEASSEAWTNTEVTTGAVAGSQINNYGQKAGKDNRVYAEVSSAPSLGGLALGGGHPCAYSPATAQISIIGGGAGIGGMKVDSACMLMVMGAAGDKAAYKASQLVIAGRDPAACRAMEQVGLVTGCKEPRRGNASTVAPKDWSKPAAPPANPAKATKGVNTGWGAKCEKVGNTIKFRPTSAAARDAELAACKARF